MEPIGYGPLTVQIEQLKQKVWNFYHQNKRNFAWREQITPYRIFVSEVMLQQTQTSRVISKFEQWIYVFPDFQSLANASAYQVLKAWQGLGYNRRGLALHAAAKMIMEQYHGQLPEDSDLLDLLPGIGVNTAGSICAFAFNKPVVFIETNIRTVFLHEFFADQIDVSDKQLLPLIQATLDKDNPREWYYALMDYGVYLKKELKANNKNSKHYIRQSKFVGSKRQVRGAIIRILTKIPMISVEQLSELVAQELQNNYHDPVIVLQDLIAEGFVKRKNERLFL